MSKKKVLIKKEIKIKISIIAMARIGEQKIAMRTRDMKTNKIARYQIILQKSHFIGREANRMEFEGWTLIDLFKKIIA